MIAAGTFSPALNKARAQNIDRQNDCTHEGMQGALQGYRRRSATWGTNRWADGLIDLDRAVTTLAATWPRQGMPAQLTAQIDAAAEAVLTACTSWLDGRKVFGHRMTGWRTASIKELYWKVAWCYSFANYSIEAFRLLQRNNTAGFVTTTYEPAPGGDPAGNPYFYPGSPYAQTTLPGNLGYRGDKREPSAIRQANGFQPVHINNAAQYEPWFTGHAMGDIVSVTQDPTLAMNAASSGSRARVVAPGAPGVDLRGGALVVRGYVYELDLGVQQGMRIHHARGAAEAAASREHVFLGLPSRAIRRWWFVVNTGGLYTYGPFSFSQDAGGAGAPPSVLPQWSANPRELATGARRRGGSTGADTRAASSGGRARAFT